MNHIQTFSCLLLLCACSWLSSEEIAQESAMQSAEETTSQQLCHLLAPLTTFAEADNIVPAGAQAIQALIEVPEDAPDDLGVGAYVKDDDGNWFQLAQSQGLKPGIHHLHFNLAQKYNWQAEPFFHTWNPYRSKLAHRYGLFFW